jgi:hypothetical protein
LGGVGKTDVAIEIAHRHDGPVAWITAESRTSLFGALTSLAWRLDVQLGSDESDPLSSLWTAMAERDNWLVVFDNAEDVELVRETLPPLTSVCVLITSQSPAWLALRPPAPRASAETGDRSRTACHGRCRRVRRSQPR